MNALTHVQDTLLVLARSGSVVHQASEGHAKNASLREIARFINTTVLPRRLEITFSDRTLVHFFAQNRRLLQYSIVESCVEKNGSDVPRQPVLCTIQDGAAIAQALTALCHGRAIELRQIHIDPAMPVSTSPGITAATVRGVIDADDQSTVPLGLEVGLLELAEKFPDQVVAAMVIDAEDLIAIVGEDDQLFAMLDWAKAAFGEGIPRNCRPGLGLAFDGWCAVTWPGTLHGSLIIVRDPERIGMIRLEGSADDAVSHWADIMNGRQDHVDFALSVTSVC